MSQTARPIADVTLTGGWTSVPVLDLGDYFTAVDEAVADDANYVWINNATGNVGFRLGEVEDPQSSADHVITVRGRHSAIFPGGVTFTVKLYQGSTVIASFSPSFGNFGNRTYTLSAAEANAITDYSDLRIAVEVTAATTAQLYISQISMSFPDAPVVTTARFYLIAKADYNPDVSHFSRLVTLLELGSHLGDGDLILIAAYNTAAQHAALIAAHPQPPGWGFTIEEARCFLRANGLIHQWWLFDQFLAKVAEEE
jgi:hypothetical protein